MLDAPITANDLYWAIVKSKNEKAPGPDGLPVEYYKVKTSLWARIFEVVYASQLEKGRMTKFQRRAHLSLLYKSGDRTVPGNYRPLTLINHDAKLGPKILARRLGQFLPDIIHDDQSGLRLNVKKTCIMPFTRFVDRQALQDLRTSSNFKVYGVSDTVKLLGVRQGAMVTTAQRLDPVLDQMRRRCAIWKYRARTLRGRVVLLRTIILPLLWYTASVTHVPSSVLKAVDIIIRNFINNHDHDDAAKPGKFDKEWIYVSVTQGGLGITRPKDFVQATHLVSLRDAISVATRLSKAPRWIMPALALFSSVLGTLGTGFDILYANIQGDKSRTCSWQSLPDFWYDTLLAWGKLHAAHGISSWQEFTQVMPFWDNFCFLFGSTKRPMHRLSIHSSRLQQRGFCRLQDFVDYTGSYPTHELLDALLEDADFARPASKTRFIRDTLRRLNLLVHQDGPFFGPTLPRSIESACHSWGFGEKLVVDMSNRDFVILLRQDSKIPALQLQQLHIADYQPSASVWRAEYSWDYHVLPVCADLKFRLQHNALGFRYKFKWRTKVDLPSLCVHGCSDDEDGQHLFWTCFVAKHQWQRYLLPFEAMIVGDFTWQMIVFPSTIRLLPSTLERFDEFAFYRVFTVVRCCVLRSLWLHRNKKMYNPEISTSKRFVEFHCRGYLGLHLRKLRSLAVQNELLKLRRLVDLLLLRLGFPKPKDKPKTTTTATATDTTTTATTTTTTTTTTVTATDVDPVFS
ncbi:hypothetical protein BBJ28_00020081 [Nothophytophthora sp. Chile5]|nr:hypothetical protein BBJ28_00020081 [Nothophytophthora sp. Chile5]